MKWSSDLDTKGTAKSAGTNGIRLIPLICAFAWFIYGGLDGVFGIIIYTASLAVTTLLGLIPFFGFMIQYVVLQDWIIPLVFDYTSLTATWLTTILFVFVMIIGFVMSVITSFLVYAYWKIR